MTLRPGAALSLLLLLLGACAAPTAPATRENLEVRGTPYERGLQHGTALRSKIHSFYTTLLTNSLFPYLSREQPDIASFLPEYSAERYQNGHFAYELMLDSAHSLEKSLPRAVRDELQGVADGSGLTYDEVLVLNTFVDTVLAVRSVALAIRLSRSPTIESLTVLGVADDGVDNDGDGLVDQPGEGVFSPWVPDLHAQLVEVPVGASFRVVLTDADGIDTAAVRLSLGGQLFTATSPGVTMTPLSATQLEVRLVPPAAFPVGAASTLVISASDQKLMEVPLPAHENVMRDEEFVFTTRGAGLTKAQVRRPALTDGRTRPAPISLGVRGAATGDGSVYMGQHFALLDANTAHKHTVVITHHPETGPSFTTVGWAGIVYGFAGMSTNGVGITCNPSDTLDNSVVGSVVEQLVDLSKAKLLAKGTPMGFAARRVLEQATSAANGREVLSGLKFAYGWTCVLGDDQGGLEDVEVDSDIFKNSNGGFLTFTPADGLASVRGDDLVISSSFTKNTSDMPPLMLAGQRIVPQRQWSGFFFRSRRAADGLMRMVDAHYGQLDVATLEQFLGDDELVDKSDSMTATVLDLKGRRVHSALGAEPATSAPWEVVEVKP